MKPRQKDRNLAPVLEINNGNQGKKNRLKNRELVVEKDFKFQNLNLKMGKKNEKKEKGGMSIIGLNIEKKVKHNCTGLFR